MDTGGFDPRDAQYLQGVDWPADKQEVGSKVESNGAPQRMLERIKNLGDGRFSGPQDVIGKLQDGR